MALNNTTRVQDMVIPEVMEAMVREKLPHALVFGAFLGIDRTLQGVPGNVVTVPKWGLIGPAEDVAELGAIPYEKLSTSKDFMTIKKAGKGVQISDEAILSGFGDPLGEATTQLTMSVARKLDADALEMFKGAKLRYSRKSEELSYGVIADAMVTFGEDVDKPRVIWVTPEQYAQLRKDPNFIGLKDLAGEPLIMSGVVGKIMSLQVKVTANKNLEEDGVIKNLILEPEAGKLLLKRDANIETERDIDHKATKANIDQHYGMYVADDTKILVLTTKKPTIKASEEEAETDRPSPAIPARPVEVPVVKAKAAKGKTKEESEEDTHEA